MHVARIDETNTVVNIEVASPEWLSRPETHAAGFRFVEYTEDNPAGIGWTFDPDTGTFTRPHSPETLPATEDTNG